MTDKQEVRQTWLFAILMGIAGLLILLIFITLRSQMIATQADQTTASSSVGNSTPTVDSITISTADLGGAATDITLVENTTSNVVTYGDYSDSNSCEDVQGNTGSPGSYFAAGTNFLYRSVVTCTGVANRDDLSCYMGDGSATVPSACVFSGCSGASDSTGHYACTLPLRYFADATDSGTYSAQNWKSLIYITDSSGASSTASSTVEVDLLNALNLSTALIDYGTLSLYTSSTDKSLRIDNTGNKDGQNFELAATNMSCSSGGSIAAAKQKFTTTSGATYANKTAIGTSSSTFYEVLSKTTVSTTPASTTMYWQLEVPSTGALGNCTGTITIVGA